MKAIVIAAIAAFVASTSAFAETTVIKKHGVGHTKKIVIKHHGDHHHAKRVIIHRHAE